MPEATAHDTLQPDLSPLSEVLNVAYAMHELVADRIEDVLKWLEAGGTEALVLS